MVEQKLHVSIAECEKYAVPMLADQRVPRSARCSCLLRGCSLPWATRDGVLSAYGARVACLQ